MRKFNIFLMFCYACTLNFPAQCQQNELAFTDRAIKSYLDSHEEIKIFKKRVNNLDTSIEEIKKNNLKSFECGKEWNNTKDTYQPTNITPSIDLDKTIETYRKNLPKITPSSSFETLLHNYEEAIRLRLTLEANDNESFLIKTYAKSVSQKTRDAQLKQWVEELKTNYTSAQLTHKDVFDLVRFHEKNAEKTIAFLLTKRKLSNEVKLKEHFLKFLKSEIPDK